jgi:hypothetical protein
MKSSTHISSDAFSALSDRSSFLMLNVVFCLGMVKKRPHQTGQRFARSLARMTCIRRTAVRNHRHRPGVARVSLDGWSFRILDKLDDCLHRT